MSARGEIAVNWEAERYKEVWREGWREVRRRRGGSEIQAVPEAWRGTSLFRAVL